MSRFKSGVGMVALVLALSGAGRLQAQDNKQDERALKTAGQFLEAMKARNLDALVKMADVPWFNYPESAGKDGVLKDQAALKKHLGRLLPPKEVTLPAVEIDKVYRWAELRDKVKESEVKLGDEILGKNGYLITFQVGSERKMGAPLLLRADKDSFRVVGMGAPVTTLTGMPKEKIGKHPRADGPGFATIYRINKDKGYIQLRYVDSQMASGPLFGRNVYFDHLARFALDDIKAFNGEGKQIPQKDAAGLLREEAVVLTFYRTPEPAYFRVLKKDAVVLVLPSVSSFLGVSSTNPSDEFQP